MSTLPWKFTTSPFKICFDGISIISVTMFKVY
jgi:hypothetical protein